MSSTNWYREIPCFKYADYVMRSDSPMPMSIYIEAEGKVRSPFTINIVFKEHTGSTLSQLLYFPVKSSPKTCPHTDVILYDTVSPVGGNLPLYSWTEQAPLNPFLELNCPPDKIFAID